MKNYKKITNKCYFTNKYFWKNKNYPIISVKKLKEVVLDIQALRCGNYDIVDSDDD